MKSGLVVTFYSYKGGVGRSFALANIGALLSMWGYKVLCVDWDLESPGLSHYFKQYLLKEGSLEVGESQQPQGILELVELVKGGESPDWKGFVSILTRLKSKGSLSFMRAGSQNASYVTRLQSLDWRELYEKHGFGDYIEKVREEWKHEYDFILVDSRTGVTDIGGITTIQLPEVFAFFFSANYQSLEGAIDVTKRVISERKNLPYDRGKLITLPVLSRIDLREEHELGKSWLKIVEKKLKPFYAEWVHKKVSVSDFIRLTLVPYVSYWSFGEKLSVVEEPRNDAESINYSLQTLAALLAKDCSETETLVENRDTFVSSVSKESISSKKRRDPQKLSLRTRCQNTIDKDDLIAWQRLIDDSGREIIQRLLDWKPKGERAAHKGGEEWENAVLEVAEICLPGFVPILTAIDKGKKNFWSKSISTLRRLAILEERMGGGATWVLNIGARMLYVAVSISSAVAVETKQVDFINEWMMLPMPNPDSNRHEQIAWAEAFSAHRPPQGIEIIDEDPFKLLLKICESDYVASFFPNRKRLEEYLYLANLLQSLVQLRRCTEKEETRKNLEEKGKLPLYVWPVWCLMDSTDFRSWTWDLFGSSKSVLNFVFPQATTVTLDKFWLWWKNWKYVCSEALRQDSIQRGKFSDVDLRVRWLMLPGEPQEKDG